MTAKRSANGRISRATIALAILAGSAALTGGIALVALDDANAQTPPPLLGGEPFVDSAQLRLVSEASGQRFFVGPGKQAGDTCFVVAPSGRPAQLGCDSPEAITRGDMFMAEEFPDGTVVGGWLVGSEFSTATVNGRTLTVDNGVIAIRVRTKGRLDLVASGPNGEIAKSLPIGGTYVQQPSPVN